MTLEQLIARHREEILALARRHGVRQVRIFGSTIRGQAGPESDVDVLVDLEPDRSLFDLGRFAIELEQLLECRVDVVTEAGLHWYIRDRVLQEAVSL